MKNYGFIKVAAAIPAVRVADCDFNTTEMARIMSEADKQDVRVLVFPELSVTGYTCQDLFRQNILITAAEESVVSLLNSSMHVDVIAIIGVPVVVGDLLLNCAAVIQKGVLLALIPKTYLPNYSEFYEKRWFASSQDLEAKEIVFAGQRIVVSPEPTLIRTHDGILFGVEICEDVWAPDPPSNYLALAGADLIFNLSASDELIGKHDYLKGLLAQQSARTITGYIYSGSGFGESTQDVVYGGNAMIFENGQLLEEAERFSLEPQLKIAQIDVERLRNERRSNSTYVNAQRGHQATIVDAVDVVERPFHLTRPIDPHPFIPKDEDMARSCEEIFSIQVCGLAKRLVHTHSQKVVIGVSGGLDSTLALLVCIRTFDKLGYDRKGIVGVTMPGFGTTDFTYQNAIALMKLLGITMREISIAKAVRQHFEDIGHDESVHDVTYENGQARERTQILMDVANQVGGLVIGTGDLSELALGWATYNGDHMSMYGVNASVPKTLIQHLIRYEISRTPDEQLAETLRNVIETPISPELTPADENGQIKQKTEDLVGPYELHDFFLYHFLRHGFSPEKILMLALHAFSNPSTYDEATIRKWLQTFLRRFFAQQFKRSCLPDGPKVGSVSLSPRGDWRMPSDANATIWQKWQGEIQ
jgi:NAD+ synthase (glutamine-hydrolysing)